MRHWTVILFLTTAGCVSVPLAPYKARTLNQSPADGPRDAREALADVRLLAGPDMLPPGPCARVELRGAVIAAIGFRPAPLREAIPALEGELDSIPAGDGEFNLNLNDIASICVEARQAFRKGGEVRPDVPKPAEEVFVCRLRLKDGRAAAFFAKDERTVQTLAAGFSYFSRRPVSFPDYFPPAGFLFAPDGPYVRVELVGGAAERAGVPLGAELLSIDGKWGNFDALRRAVRGLSRGWHSLRYRLPEDAPNETARRAEFDVEYFGAP